MSAEKKKGLPVSVARPVKQALEALSAELETSINNVAVGIIADHYAVSFVGTGRGPRAGNGSTQMNLPLPVRLYDLIDRDSRSRRGVKRSKNEIVERIFCERFGIDYDRRHELAAA